MANTKFHWHVDHFDSEIKVEMERCIKDEILKYIDDDTTVHVYLDEYKSRILTGFITDNSGTKLFKIKHSIETNYPGSWSKAN